MSIDIYVRWTGQTDQERDAQREELPFDKAGKVGHIREAHYGHPYAAMTFVPEAFLAGGRTILDAETLRDRLTATLPIVETRCRIVYGITSMKVIEQAKQSFRDFVDLCENVEKRTGSPVTIVVTW